jgi:2',3'-cyclic-nucleotide 2'-phosphodiesterase/3'-nucleotidase
MRHIIKFTLFIFFAVAASCLDVKAQFRTTIKIIQTSDVHGALFPFDFINNRAVDYGLSQVYTYVRQERARNPKGVVLLDNGDILQGQPTVYFANFVDSSDTHIISQVMNYMGYDAGTVGNHDLEAGPKVYNRLVAEFNHPWLAANAVSTTTGKPYFKPYHIIEREGVRIAVLGLITPGIPKWLSPSLWPNMVFTDMVDAAKMWMDTIRIKEKPHIVVGLFHSGHNASYEGQNASEKGNENASLLVAQQVPGFDAVFIGHDHDRVNMKVANANGDTVVILDPGSHARLMSDLTIDIELSSSGEVIEKKITGKLVEVRNLIPDPDYVAQFSTFSAKVADFVDRRIGSFQSSVTTRDSYFGPSSFMNILHSVQMSISNAQISFAAPLMFDATIEQGPVFVRDMFKLYSYENHLYLVTLTGKEIKEYLEYSTNLWFNMYTNSNDNLLKLRKNSDGSLVRHNNGRALLASSFYNFDSAAGIKYQLDLSKPYGERVSIEILENGEPFDLAKTYKVALNSYRGNGGGGHLTDGVGLSREEVRKRMISASPLDMRYYLMKWIERNGKITPEKTSNWTILPSEWAEKTSASDRILLFGDDQ